MDKETLRADFIAGLTVSLVLIPQSMAYAELAGLPAWIGLYAAFLPVIVAAMWGSSHQLQTGPVAMTSLLTLSTLQPLASVGSEQFVALAAVCALLVGIVRLVIGFCKLTFFINFLSKPVILGFVNAGALVIALSQVNLLFGMPMPKSDSFLTSIWQLAGDLHHLHFPAFLIGISSIVIILGLRKWNPRIPAALTVVVLMSFTVWIFGLSSPGIEAENGVRCVAIVGHVPAGVPKWFFQIPSLYQIREMFGGVLMITFIGFMEMCSVTKGIAAKTKQKINMDQEMIGQGLAGIASSLSGSYPPSGSFSRSALNYEAGAKTGMSSVFTGIIVLLTLLFFTKFLYYLPKSALAAIIFAAVFGLINIRKMVENWKISWEDGLTGTLTFAATLLFAPDLVKGILIGVFSSIFLYLYRTMKPRVAVLGLHSDGTYRDADLHNLSIDEEMPIIRFDGRLYFANVAYFEDTMLAVLSRFPNARAVAVACDGINDIDASGVEVIEELVRSLGKGKLPLYFIGIKQHVYERMERSGLIDLIGKDNIFRKIEEVRSISRNS